MFNFKSAAFKKSGLDPDSLTDGRLLDLLVEEPRYFRRPLMRKNIQPESAILAARTAA